MLITFAETLSGVPYYFRLRLDPMNLTRVMPP
jgi:hypothetical protein